MATNTPAQKSRRITILSLGVFFALLLALTWFLVWSDATRKIDYLMHDNWVRFSQTSPPEQVAIAAIDTPSLQALGRWPWSRNLQALLLQKLGSYNAKAVVVDILFNEESANTNDDQELIEALSGLNTVIVPVLTEGRQVAREVMPFASVMHKIDGMGHIILPFDNDGITRRVFLKGGSPTPHWSTLALEAYTKIEHPYDDFDDSKLPGKKTWHDRRTDTREPFGGRTSPGEQLASWEQDYEVLVPFYGPRGTIPYVSAETIIDGSAPPEALADKVVFVGMTSTGLGDDLPTPVSALDQPLPGVEIHANIYSALLDGRLKATITPYLMFSFLLYRLTHNWFAPMSASIPLFISYILWSWNRLNYLNRFLEAETALLEPLTQSDNTENAYLADFFRTAERHLPIQAWRFSAKGQSFSSATDIGTQPETLPMDRWVNANGVYSKRYPTPGKLEISLAIEDEKVASDLTGYVDTLARVQSRTKPPPLSGSIERLQINTFKLSEQVDWLRTVSAFSDSILEGSPAGLIVWNAAGEMKRCNELVFELIPSIENDIYLLDFVNKITRKESGNEDDRRRTRELILDSAAWQITYVDGERETVVNFNTVGDSLSDRLVCATVIDVSEIRSAERARSEMVDYLSHDLRSPLISALYLLESDGDEMTIEVEKRVEANINRSLNMMDDLLHVSRADSLSSDNFEEVLFNAVVDNALDQLLPQARSRDISFEIETTDDDLWMNGDIDPAMMGDLFTRFKRDSKIAKKFQGIGLGLALVARVVQQHSGEVNAVSPGTGTTIRMSLPLLSVEDSPGG